MRRCVVVSCSLLLLAGLLISCGGTAYTLPPTPPAAPPPSPAAGAPDAGVLPATTAVAPIDVAGAAPHAEAPRWPGRVTLAGTSFIDQRRGDWTWRVLDRPPEPEREPEEGAAGTGAGSSGVGHGYGVASVSRGATGSTPGARLGRRRVKRPRLLVGSASVRGAAGRGDAPAGGEAPASELIADEPGAGAGGIGFSGSGAGGGGGGGGVPGRARDAEGHATAAEATGEEAEEAALAVRAPIDPDGLVIETRPPIAAREARPLKAGATDDNADFEAFLAYLVEKADDPSVKQFSRPLAVEDRRLVRVVDRAGRPLPGAHVAIIDEAADRIVWRGTTYGDGRMPFYPAVAELAMPPAAPLLVQVGWKDALWQKRWDGADESFEVALNTEARGTRSVDPVGLDVLFLIDTTGSMADEIARIRETLLATTQRLRELDREFDLRYGAILYRDIYDDYLTAAHPFTGDIGAFDAALEAVVAGGGGDTPESLNQGLAEAVHRLRWRDGVAKVVFLIADAPPHMDYEGDTPYTETLRDAVAAGIRVHTVAASGLDAGGTYVFRQIAQFTRGRFIFIEYGSTAATAARHGVTGRVESNNLDEILFEQIRWELAHWGRDPA